MSSLKSVLSGAVASEKFGTNFDKYVNIPRIATVLSCLLVVSYRLLLGLWQDLGEFHQPQEYVQDTSPASPTVEFCLY